jgi:DNA segregation ATPase FtsK/SpoIIIE-like protein
LPYPAIAIGAQLDFTPYWDCLDHIPHLLIAGKTGSGKSVLIRSLLWQLTRLYRPDELDLVLIGPKAADYMDFTTAPHFKSPSDIHLRSEGAIDLLREIVEVRYLGQQAIFDQYAQAALSSGTRISNLRELMAHAAAADQPSPLRPFVVIIDEFVELLEGSPGSRKEFEALIGRFSRLFRYIGGTMIAATQRPSVKSITGDIKANFRPLALRVERAVDSRVILDENGAEQLIGQGDLLYKTDDGIIRLQGYAALGTYLR